MGLAGLAGGPARYWVSFFPGIVVLGLGMGLTVAPLTTTVMNAVRPELAGTASGVNNAVARIAGVLAIAVMGALALGLFAGRLGERTASLNLPPEARAALSTEAARLGAAAVPAQVAPERAPAVAAAIRLAFVDTFQVVMFTGVGLAWLGALLAGLVVEGRRA